uniref:WWE domain-containing protein n=1 Tax=Arcella intermedia TaxID=1963864 RepID=A0A6B2KXQ9_9EUKA
MPGVTFVNDKESAEEVIKILYQYKDRYHACDTEATDIDVRTQSPIGCGRVISASVYVGPDANFGNGPRIFIDNLEPYEDTIQYFKEYFEDPTIYKVWHNYSFDRHMMYNHGINVQGFGGDTMHMARLENASRVSFSLESLSKEILLNSKHKRGMLERFGEYPTKKDGDPAKDMRLAPFHEIQRNPKKLCAWIDYSTLDTDSTWHLREALHRRLNLMPWEPEKSTMWDFYQHLWAPFGELLTDMEREGIKVDVPYLAEILPKAYEDKKALEDKFLQWAEKMCPDCKYMNAHSDAQKQQLLFAPTRNSKKKLEMPPTREFKVPNVLNKSEVFWKWQNEINEWSTFDTSTNNTLETLLKEIVPDIDTAEYNELIEKIPQDTEPIEITLNGRPCWLSMKDLTYTDIESFHVHKIKRMVNKPKKDMTINIKGLGLAYTEITISGWPSVSSSTISRLAGNPPKSYGAAKMLMEKQGHNGEEACEALSSLTKANAVETLINSFISPLPTMTDQNHRIHCSLNLNTETGRLSSRKPNLQNQPALDKDTYKIRKAYTCEKGNTLIVADYGQLELRLLAHVSNCKSMIDAFKSGGDFHSRTALGMYPAIQEAINSGKVLLEWDSTKGKSPVPLLKDAFGTERRRAKTLNFSIAYGKTVHGLAKDWSVSTEEAKDTLEKWYADRPEVRLWQQKMIAYAKVTGYTRTLLGRYRKLAPLINSDVKSLASHAERAAINTPLQGGAADIVTRAMILLHRSEKLKKMGWKQLLQIHDELIFEGPAESAEEAKDHIVQVMEHPLEYPLLIDLIVDAKTADNWYAAK